MKEVRLTFDDTWYGARSVFAITLNCHPDRLQLGYILPWRTLSSARNAQPIPTSLADGDEWNILKRHVRDYINSEQAKNRGKGVVPPFTIPIVRLDDPKPETMSLIAATKQTTTSKGTSK